MPSQVGDLLANGSRYWRLVEKQAQKRESLQVQRKANKTRCVPAVQCTHCWATFALSGDLLGHVKVGDLVPGLLVELYGDLIVTKHMKRYCLDTEFLYLFF